MTDRLVSEDETTTQAEVPTERRNPRTADLDLLSTLDMLRLINAEDACVAAAVERALPDLARAVDAAVGSLRAGRRVHYFGAGTSGRLAVLDAAELGPTFSLEPGRVVAHHAGGADALGAALEGVEDDAEAGAEAARELMAGDAAVGLTASGRTPYVAGALRSAAGKGAVTVLVSSDPEALLAADADIHVCVDTGAEVIAGSTRMKAGTAQKLVLNAFSTAVMVRLGRTYSNLMASMVPSNAKLDARLVTILAEATGRDRGTCVRVLRASDGELKTALVSMLSGSDRQRARAALDRSGGLVREALHVLDGV